MELVIVNNNRKIKKNKNEKIQVLQIDSSK